MDIMEIMKVRHSVRQYTDKKIEDDKREKLKSIIRECNEESGLNIQILFDEPKCFDSFMAHYGKFVGVENYIALVGKKSDKLDEICGYYGEKIVLSAQEMGLNTCWVVSTHGKTKAQVEKGEKLICVIAIGYGVNQGVEHKNKSWNQVCKNNYDEVPDWFKKGMEAVMLAPTAINQQKFVFSLDGEDVLAKAGRGFVTKLDLGIVKYHFERVSGHKVK